MTPNNVGIINNSLFNIYENILIIIDDPLNQVLIASAAWQSLDVIYSSI